MRIEPLKHKKREVAIDEFIYIVYFSRLFLGAYEV